MKPSFRREVAANTLANIIVWLLAVLWGVAVVPATKWLAAATGQHWYFALGWVIAITALAGWGVSHFRTLRVQHQGPDRDSAAPIDVEADARRKAIRIQVGQFLRDTYDQAARHAIGQALGESNRIIGLLRDPKMVTPQTPLVVDYLSDLCSRTEAVLHPLLRTQGCATEEDFQAYVVTWGEMFRYYQLLVQGNVRALTSIGVSPWRGALYHEWRDLDATFLARLRRAEHMEGCERLAIAIREVGWHEDSRPAKPDAKDEAPAASTRTTAQQSKRPLHPALESSPSSTLRRSFDAVNETLHKIDEIQAAEANAPLLLSLSWGLHANGITIRGTGRSTQVIPGVQCVVTGMELWSADDNQYAQVGELYPGGMFEPLMLTGRADLGLRDSVDFGFIHRGPERLDLHGQGAHRTLRRHGRWRINCRITSSRKQQMDAALCLLWESSDRLPVGIDCPEVINRPVVTE